MIPTGPNAPKTIKILDEWHIFRDHFPEVQN